MGTRCKRKFVYCFVQVRIGYARPRSYNIHTPTRKHISKAVARGSKVAVALHCLEDKKVRQHIIRKIGKTVRGEIAKLCSKSVTVLHKKKVNSFMEFSWSVILEEMRDHTPVLLEILKQSTSTARPRPNRHLIIAMCVAMLCKLRNSDMSLVHQVISLILYAGHSSKQVCPYNYSYVMRLHYMLFTCRCSQDFTSLEGQCPTSPQSDS